VIRHPRLTIARSVGVLLGLTVVGLLVGASAETCAGAVRLLTGGVLMLSAIGAVCRGAGDRPYFLGFAVFGWGYFALAHWYSYHEGPLPTVGFVPGSVDHHADLLALPPQVRVAHDAWALGIAYIGSMLAGRLFAHSAASAHVADEAEPPAGDAARWWRKPAVLGLSGFGLVAIAWLAGRNFNPAVGAGNAFLLTWALMGLAVLGAVIARGRSREAWIGAASFGLSYLILAFSPIAAETLPTNHLLNAVFRPDGPKATVDLDDDELTPDDESRQLRKALAEPVSLRYPRSATIRVVLDRIKAAVRVSMGNDPVIYLPLDDFRRVNPEFDGHLVTIDRDNIPAKDALRLCLGQLGLTYRIQSGYIRILPDVYQPVPFAEDPVMIAGHSLLALIAAAIGGVLSPIVADRCRRHDPIR
jgi:hypothetical protein